ncbi:CAP domain-containing protein [Actinacidiphila acidipaludis]|uniref:SCP domain-containing protein n=1 Tax=Actinacidiphila acidipaludis TaxID=2873382 RepID=A0ABS7QFS3_9ACTN|nr:CAP domain-containing protein [Streptomyces acidipaludis]MBY8882010.1 hypothetical protein [Streptomyces acidipaludis]
MSSHSVTPRPHRHRAPRKPRTRIALTGAAALAVVSGGTAFACMGQPGHSASGTSPFHLIVPADWHDGTPADATTPPPAQPGHAPTAHHHGTAPAHHPRRPTATPSPTRSTPAPSHSATPPASPAPSASPVASDDAVQQVLDLINRARAQQGLPAYRLLDGLTSSATQHNQVMSGGCGLSHQCPGESPIGDRETANGVHWSSAGENIGVGGPVADTPQAIAAMAVNLTQSMLDEQAPNDGHRRNILSGGFTYIGIAVHRDASGSVWLTQDFASLM